MIKCICCFNKLMKTIALTLLYSFFLLIFVRTKPELCPECDFSIESAYPYLCGENGLVYSHFCWAFCSNPSVEIIFPCWDYCETGCKWYVSNCYLVDFDQMHKDCPIYIERNKIISQKTGLQSDLNDSLQQNVNIELETNQNFEQEQNRIQFTGLINKSDESSQFPRMIPEDESSSGNGGGGYSSSGNNTNGNTSINIKKALECDQVCPFYSRRKLSCFSNGNLYEDLCRAECDPGVKGFIRHVFDCDYPLNENECKEDCLDAVCRHCQNEPVEPVCGANFIAYKNDCLAECDDQIISQDCNGDMDYCTEFCKR